AQHTMILQIRNVENKRLLGVVDRNLVRRGDASGLDLVGSVGGEIALSPDFGSGLRTRGNRENTVIARVCHICVAGGIGFDVHASGKRIRGRRGENGDVGGGGREVRLPQDITCRSRGGRKNQHAVIVGHGDIEFAGGVYRNPHRRGDGGGGGLGRNIARLEIRLAQNSR